MSDPWLSAFSCFQKVAQGYYENDRTIDEQEAAQLRDMFKQHVLPHQGKRQFLEEELQDYKTFFMREKFTHQGAYMRDWIFEGQRSNLGDKDMCACLDPNENAAAPLTSNTTAKTTTDVETTPKTQRGRAEAKPIKEEEQQQEQKKGSRIHFGVTTEKKKPRESRNSVVTEFLGGLFDKKKKSSKKPATDTGANTDDTFMWADEEDGASTQTQAQTEQQPETNGKDNNRNVQHTRASNPETNPAQIGTETPLNPKKPIAPPQGHNRDSLFAKFEEPVKNTSKADRKNQNGNLPFWMKASETKTETGQTNGWPDQIKAKIDNGDTSNINNGYPENDGQDTFRIESEPKTPLSGNLYQAIYDWTQYNEQKVLYMLGGKGGTVEKENKDTGKVEEVVVQDCVGSAMSLIETLGLSQENMPYVSAHFYRWELMVPIDTSGNLHEESDGANHLKGLLLGSTSKMAAARSKALDKTLPHLQFGDFLFFATKSGMGAGHVAIYVPNTVNNQTISHPLLHGSITLGDFIIVNIETGKIVGTGRSGWHKYLHTRYIAACRHEDMIGRDVNPPSK